MKLAIVGSVQFAHPRALQMAGVIIEELLDPLSSSPHRPTRPVGLISGGAEGIDSLAESIADRLGVPKCIHLPKNPRWKPDGYEDRNKLIAEGCDYLVAIRCHASKTYGSGWTADYAQRIGREVWRITL